MSKRRHKSRSKQETTSNDNINNKQQVNNNPFGINPNQLLSLFGNIDMNQINSMLQSMGTEGFDFNNFNLGSIQNLMTGMGRGEIPQTQQGQRQQTNQKESQGIKNQQSHVERTKKNSVEVEDENIQMLISLRSIVNEERGEFIDRVIKLYNEGAFEE